MVLHYLQPSLSGGEISPSLYARVDTADYTTCVKQAENMFVHPQGGVSNRPGTRLRAVSKNGQACKIIPFVIGDSEAYMVEMGNNYVRFHTSSGLVLNDQEQPYELQTPYGIRDLEEISYTQYNEKLYITHPGYAPCYLSRISNGRFEFQTVALQYGPFKKANENTAHHVRVYATQDRIVTTGIAAALSFQPIAYDEYTVWAFFNNEWFYAALDYGLNVSEIVDAFNEHFQTRGLHAFNLGGVIKIESPAATGGDWNGASFSLEYRRMIDQNPEITVVQTLEGGVNAGTEIPQGEVHHVLASDFDCFTPSQVGGRFLLAHTVDGQYQTGVLGYEGTSGVISSGGDWSLRTSGTWTGRLLVEVSQDGGQTWSVLKILSRQSGEDNFSVLGDLNDDENLFLLRLRSEQVSGEVGYELFAQTFVQEGVVRIDTYVNAREVVVSVERACGSQAWTTHFAEGAFSPAAGFPRCVFFYQNRLGFAATQDEPQTLWFSKTGSWTHFGHSRNTLKDDDAFSVYLSGKKLTAIRSVVVTNRLIVLTAGSEWTVCSSGAFTPYTVQVEQQSELGCFHTAPVLVGNKVLFVQARGGVLRNFYYDYNTASYCSNDLTLRARHLFFNHTISQLCFQQEPDKLVWCVLNDGSLLSLTYEEQQGIYAWTHHHTQGQFVQVCTLAQEGYDEVWCVVKRGDIYMLESFVKRLASKAPQEQCFLDSAVCFKQNEPVTQLNGLSHLEGQEVVALADGNPVYGLCVNNGQITLPYGAKQVWVGLSYTSVLETLPACFSRSNGTVMDQKKRLVAVTAKLLDSRGGWIGTDEANLSELVQRTHEKWNESTALLSEQFKKILPGSHVYLPSVLVVQKDPLPLTVLALITQVV